MNKGDVLTTLAEALHEVGRVDPAAVRPDASLFTDLNADSMVIAEALLILEERLGLAVNDDFAEDLTTVGDLADHILAQRPRNAVFETYRRRLDTLRKEGLYREFTPCSPLAEDRGHAMYAGRKIQVWCSNDYLGMSRNEDVIATLMRSTALHGTGSGGSRNISGTSVSHVALEERLTAWHGKKRALLFSSGYNANTETLRSIISAVPDMVVFSDALNHRSLIEGIRAAKCRKHVFPHNDVATLRTQLAAHGGQPKLIVFESVYSMDGDFAPIREICDLAEEFDALTYIDESHAIGANGPTGAGLCEELGENRATFIQGGMGKAVGTSGGYVAGPDVALDYVRSFAPGFIFTTTLPQATLDATLRSISVIQGGSELRRDLSENVRYLKSRLRAAGIDFIDAESHLVPVMVPGSERIKRVSRTLLDEHDIYVQPINFPTVQKGKERKGSASPWRPTGPQHRSTTSWPR